MKNIFENIFKKYLISLCNCVIIVIVAINALLAQLDRVFGYEPKGQGFESLTARHIRSAQNRFYLFGTLLFLRKILTYDGKTLFYEYFGKKIH